MKLIMVKLHQDRLRFLRPAALYRVVPSSLPNKQSGVLSRVGREDEITLFSPKSPNMNGGEGRLTLRVVCL
jgi:hypothetical protein